MTDVRGKTARSAAVVAAALVLASSLGACIPQVSNGGSQDSTLFGTSSSDGTPRVLTQSDTVTCVGSLVDSQQDVGFSGTYVVGAQVAGTRVTGTLADLLSQRDATMVSSGAVVTSNLGEALNGVQAINTSFVAVDGTDEDTNVAISDANASFSDDSAGMNACDLTGLGSVFVASGSDHTSTRLTLERTNVVTEGFMRDGIVVADHADAVLTDCNLLTAGNNPLNNAYEGYASSGKRGYQTSPPWVLGIYGGVRTANVVGDRASLTLVDSNLETGSGAALSADSCKDPTINVVNSTLAVSAYDGDEQAGNSSRFSMNGGTALFGYDRIYGSGCGLYGTGAVRGNFLGATVDGTTYAAILEGSGPVQFGASNKSQELRNEAANSTVLSYAGPPQDTVVNSVFGIMSRGNNDQVTIDAGSVWNTEEAVILARGPQRTSFVVSGATLNPSSGVLFQMMDDEVGYGTSESGGDVTGAQGFHTWKGDPWGTPTYSSGFRDPNQPGFATPTAGGSYDTTLSLQTGADGKPVTYRGNILNGTGTGKGTTPGGLSVTMGKGVTLKGAITSTSAVHGLPYSLKATAYLDTLAEQYGDKGTAPNGGKPYNVRYTLLDADGKVCKDENKAVCIQVNEFTMNEYFLMSHVMNRSMMGANVLVTVDEGATWEVTQNCFIKGLVNHGSVKVAKGVTLYVGGQPYDGTSPTAGEVPQPPAPEPAPEDALEGEEPEEDEAPVEEYEAWE